MIAVKSIHEIVRPLLNPLEARADDQPHALSMEESARPSYETRMLMKTLVWTVLTCVLASCSFHDARTAHAAQQRLIGWSELDLETCVGAPDQRSTFGDTDILTYFSSSTNNTGFNVGMPLLFGGFTLLGGGNCHATFTVKDGRVAEVRYTGETDAMLAPDAYCAPIVRTCVRQVEQPGASPSITPEVTPRATAETRQ